MKTYIIKMLSLVAFVIVGGALLLTPPKLAAQTETVTLQRGLDGYNGVSDNALASNLSANNYGAWDQMIVGRNNTRRTIIRYDLSDYSALVGSVESASLTLTLLTGAPASAASFTIGVYQITAANADWIEGTGTGTVPDTSSGVSTWSAKARDTTAWAGSVGLSTPGVDYIADAIYTFEWTPSSTSVTIPITSTVIMDWLENPTNNGGLILIPIAGSTANNIAANFASSEASIAGERPTLEFTYIPIPEPGSITLFTGMLVLLLVFTQRRK